MSKVLRWSTAACLVSVILASPAWASIYEGPLPLVGAGLPILVLAGAGYFVARLLRRKAD